MVIEWVQVGLNAVPGVLAAVVSSGLTARWAVSRFRSEKWWERKATTYTDIVRALFLVQRYIDDWIENIETGTRTSEEYEKHLLEDWRIGSRAVDEATVVGSFIISAEAAAVLRTLRKESKNSDPDDPHDRAVTESVALSKAIPAFVESARKDLDIGKTGRAARLPSLLRLALGSKPRVQ